MKAMKVKKKKAILKPTELTILMSAYASLQEGLQGAVFVNSDSEQLVTQALNAYYQIMDKIADRILHSEAD